MSTTPGSEAARTFPELIGTAAAFGDEKLPRAYAAITREDVPMQASNKVARRQIAAPMADRLERAI